MVQFHRSPSVPRTRRRLPRRLRAGLVALAVAAAGLFAVPAAHANTTICGKTDHTSVSGGRYIVQNNEWNDSIQQCVEAWDGGFGITDGWHNLGNGNPAAYPSVYAGCHYTNCTTGSGLPLQVSSFGNPQSSSNFYTASGAWDASWDIWFDTQPSASGQNDGAELMIWADHSGFPNPAGTEQPGTVWIEGAAWNVWVGRLSNNGISWNVVSYVRQQADHNLTVNIKDFTNDMQSRGQAQPQWYMTSVQFGFEPWQGGPGLGVTSFSFNANGSDNGGGSATEVVGQGSGRCIDVNGHGTADGNPVQLWDCAGSANQEWTATGGRLVGQESGKCLDVSGGGTADGTKVQLWTCNGTGAQQWQTQADGNVVNTASGKCLDADGQATANGTGLQIWDCAGTPTQANQVWTMR